MDTKKAIIFNSRTEEAGLNILSDKTKKENDSVYFMNRAKFTTSADIDNPEYYFLLRKAKVIPGQKIITGPTNMYIADVPTPIGLPFAYFPISNKRSSGIIFPSFGEQNSRGYFIQNGGYYLPINDNLDLTLLGDYYTNGSYGFRVENTYIYRYKFRGNLSFRFENLIQSERGFPDYSKSSIYNLRWSHSQDTKSNPNSRFSASVNLGSSKYYQQSVNQMNAANFLNNSLSSSVSYSKTFPGEPQVNMSLSATHSQNTNTQTINMTLPTFQGSVSRIYPFAPKVGTKKGIIQNVNFQYNVRAENRIQTTDSLFFKKEMFETAKELGISVDKTMGIGKLIDEIFSEKCEKHYIQPTFITDYPKEMSPLTKEHRDNPKLTERFELLVNGKELANAYSELNDPIDQLSRFEEQLKLSEKGDDEAMFIDNDFIRALEYGMPPTSGIGIGIDRLVMLFTNNKSIQEVIFFPQMKPESSEPKPKKEDFINLGISQEWVDYVMEVYSNIDNLLSSKSTQVHQKLNGFRKKHKLNIKALQLDEVIKWFE